MEKASQTTYRDLLGRSLDRRKTNKVSFEIPKLTTPFFLKLAPSLENSVKNSMEVKKAEVKAKLQTGMYMFKETKAKFSSNTDTPL